MRYRLQRHDGTDCSATMVPITVLRMVPIQRYRHYLHLIDEAIGLLNTEIRLIEWRIKYPEQLQQRTNKQALSPLYLADRTTLINIMEIVSGLFLSQKIVYQNGKPVYLVDLTKAFEWLFNIKIGDCYQKHEDVIKRKPGKLTEFLNGLAELIRKEHDKKGYR